MSSTLTRTLLRPTTRLTLRPALRMASNPARSEAPEARPTFGLATRQPSEEERKLVDDILNLYQLRPISQAYQHYDQKAIFHDPIGIAQGLEEIKAQFNAMPKIFKASETKYLAFLDNPEIKPPSIQISLSQEYHLPTGGTKTTDSKVTFERDPGSGLILKHIEEWAGEKNATSEDGFLGKIQEARKKFTAKLVNAVTDSTPADQK